MKLATPLLLLLTACARFPEATDSLCQLQEAFPVGYPVELREDADDDHWGESEWDEERSTFIIHVHKNVDPETMAHEWAHLMTWDFDEPEDHSDQWGVAYARCYRLLIEP